MNYSVSDIGDILGIESISIILTVMFAVPILLMLGAFGWGSILWFSWNFLLAPRCGLEFITFWKAAMPVGLVISVLCMILIFKLTKGVQDKEA